MIEETPSQLPADIIASADRLLDLLSVQKGQLLALRQSTTHDEAVTNYTEAVGTQCNMLAEVNKLKAWISAGRMTGVVAQPSLMATRLELHPVNHPRLPLCVDPPPRRRDPAMLAANDHSLDPDTEEGER